MPDPKDPTPVRVKQRNGEFVLVDSSGNKLPESESYGNRAAAQADAGAINASWKKAKAGRRAKGAPEITEARARLREAEQAGDAQAFTEALRHLRETVRSPTIIHFDPSLHPRGRLGQFIDALGRLGRGQEMTLPGGQHIKRDVLGFALTTQRGGKKKVKHFRSPQKLAQQVIGPPEPPPHYPGAVETPRLSFADTSRVEPMASPATPSFKKGDVLTLPFFAGEPPSSEEDLQYEVEKIDKPSSDGSVRVVLFQLRDGERERTEKGHFRRATRYVHEIEADLAARRKQASPATEVKKALAGPALTDYAGRARHALSRSRQAQRTATELRIQGNTEHAQDYDEMAARFRQSAEELLGKVEQPTGEIAVGERVNVLPEEQGGLQLRGVVQKVTSAGFDVMMVGRNDPEHFPRERVVRQEPMASPVTLQPYKVPAEWRVKHGYGHVRYAPQKRADEERMMFHWLTGRPPPENLPPGAGAEQFAYTRKGQRKAEYQERAAGLAMASPSTPGGDRVMGTDAAVTVGRFSEGGPEGFRARTWPGAKVRKRRETAVEDERRWLEIRHRDLSTGDLPNVSDLKYLTDDQVKQLVDRIIPQRKGRGAPVVKGEPWPESDPAYKDYPRRIAEEGNRRADRWRQSGPPEMQSPSTARYIAERQRLAVLRKELADYYDQRWREEYKRLRARDKAEGKDVSGGSVQNRRTLAMDNISTRDTEYHLMRMEVDELEQKLRSPNLWSQG